MEVSIDQDNVTPRQENLLESYGISLQKRDPHPRRGPYKYGYYIMNSSGQNTSRILVYKSYLKILKVILTYI